MENLITCSRCLYDKDISEKMKEITYLKRKLRFYETPKIEYYDLEKWKIKKEEAYQIVKNGLNKWITENNLEYQHMSSQGLTIKQQINIKYYIEKALNLITKENNKEWVEMISIDIISGIEGIFNGFIETGIWDLIYSQLNAETMSNLIYNIIWQLYNCILEDIAIFTCEISSKKTYINKPQVIFDKPQVIFDKGIDNV